MKLALAIAAGLALPGSAFAQAHQGQHDMAAEPEKPKTPPAEADPHAGHDMSGMEENPTAPAQAVDPACPPEHAKMGHCTPKTDAPAPAADPHAGHDMGSMPNAEQDGEVGSAPAPAPPGDHVADSIYGADVMSQSRKELAYEVGGMGYSLVILDLAEVGFHKGHESYRFEGEVFTGGNINRFGVKFEGEGVFGKTIDDLELQALYSRAIAPYWNLQAGIRHDIRPDPSRTYAVAGVEGLAPYWFKINAAAFLSNKGEVRARAEGSYDLRLTQELILQPRIEANLSFQDIPAIGVGSGLTDFEAGLRLRYEIRQEFAPYVGVEWRRKTGDTARFARLAGDDPDTLSVVTGVRIWF